MKKPTAEEEFKQFFSEIHLRNEFENIKKKSATSGVDMITPAQFETNIDQNVEIIERKVNSSKYRITRYKLKLALKGRNKPPREISIPTIRDKLVLRLLNQFLQSRLERTVSQPLPHEIIREVKNFKNRNLYDSAIRVDIENFYPSINHQMLMSILKTHIKYEPAIALIGRSITTPTTAINEKSAPDSISGVPQGLPVSNILSSLYLKSIDKWGRDEKDIAYFRYVDDILILCNKDYVDKYKYEIEKRLRKLNLKNHEFSEDSKSRVLPIDTEFTYLGYNFNDNNNPNVTSVRKSSVAKLRQSIVGLFTAYANNPDKQGLLEWKLNLRICGCVSEGKTKGWLFYFSEIDDKTLLYKLNAFVSGLQKRFKTNLKLTSFVRAHHETKRKRKSTKYIVNFDNFTLAQMHHTIRLLRPDIKHRLSRAEIEKIFWWLISKETKNLESDLLDIS